MKKVILVLASGAVLGAAFSARACVNEYAGPLVRLLDSVYEGRVSRWRSSGLDLPTAEAAEPARILAGLVRAPPRADWAGRERSLRAEAAGPNAPFQARSDYAAALLHLGRVRETLAILEPLAEAHPREYRILATLGTAYELDGQVESALKNILAAMMLNPESHAGTEWLHVKILEAKLALAKNPQWLQVNSVLGYRFDGPNPLRMPEGLANNPKEVARITDAIVYQLQERLQFVRPPDPTVADLLFDMANLYAAAGLPESAAPLYKASLKFGDLRKEAIGTRLKKS